MKEIIEIREDEINNWEDEKFIFFKAISGTAMMWLLLLL